MNCNIQRSYQSKDAFTNEDIKLKNKFKKDGR